MPAVQCKKTGGKPGGAVSARWPFLVPTAGVLSLNRYVNTVVEPTLHELAELRGSALPPCRP